MTYDLVIHHGTILTVNTANDIISDGLICIDKTRLARVEARQPGTPLPAARKTIDAGGGLILPGLVNTHTHLPMTLLRGLADDLPLDVWLNEYIFPTEGRCVNPEMVRTGARLAAAEMLLSGTTTCCDGYFHEDHVAGAISQTGLRAVLGQGVIDFPAPGVPDPSRNIQAAADFIDHWKNKAPLITPSVFCHSPYTCGPETLQAAKKLADDRNVLFQIHVAETRTEVAQSRAAQGDTPVAYLDRLGLLDRHTLLVHGVHLSKADMDILARSGAGLSHNPESNLKLGAGIAPVPALAARGITVGLGTDGCASNNDLDLFGEMDTAAKIHKGAGEDPTVMDARSVLRMATIDGARAIGLDALIGSLETGKQADVIILNTRRPHLVPLYHPASHIVYAARGSDVNDTIIAGQRRVADGRLTALDLDAIIDAARIFGRRIQPGPPDNPKEMA